MPCLLALAALALCLLPAVARADPAPPTVTLTTTVGKPDKRGGVKHTLSWTATCADPTHEIAVGVTRVMALKGRARPVLGPVQWLDDARPGAGSFTMSILPGQRYKPRVEVRCRERDSDLESAAFAETPKWFSVPPRILSWQRAEGEVCTVHRDEGTERFVQARMAGHLEFEALYDEDTLLRKPDKGIVLVVRGGGLRTRIPMSERGTGRFDRPEKFLRFWVTFKRPGTAKVWVELDGDRTNALTIRVARLPSGCGEFASIP